MSRQKRDAPACLPGINASKSSVSISRSQHLFEYHSCHLNPTSRRGSVIDFHHLQASPDSSPRTCKKRRCGVIGVVAEAMAVAVAAVEVEADVEAGVSRAPCCSSRGSWKVQLDQLTRSCPGGRGGLDYQNNSLDESDPQCQCPSPSATQSTLELQALALFAQVSQLSAILAY